MRSTSSTNRARLLQRTALVTLVVLSLIWASPGGPFAHVETLTRFLEYDQTQGTLSYEITLRNLGNLPVSYVDLSTEPAALEGPLELMDLGKEKQVSRRFTFRIPPGEMLFQPQFSLTYTNYEGERVRITQERPYLAVTVDFVECDLESGRLAMSFTLTNPHPEPVIFLELKSENPKLEEDKLELGDLGAGSTLTQILDFRIPPGESFFNPTLYLSYHAFHTEGTRFHRSFHTVLQPDLGRIQAALRSREQD